MTDQHAGYVVTLASNIREDDAEPILNAIRLIRGVQGVEPVVMSPEIHIATMRAETKIGDRVRKALADS